MDLVKRFDVYLVQLDPTQGCEMQKTRPCVIVSPNEMNQLQTVIVAPMTSTIKFAPWRVQIKFRERAGNVALDQIRAIDRSRLLQHLGRLNKTASASILDILQEMFSP
ncbi:MAG: type II toxin-antitoxin system PemK/MazF family toxin [Magnetococcales bacterium]|nr:type II toxin-antitoxin system PemK/MazF family toxin [Magnetococcales bacterium]